MEKIFLKISFVLYLVSHSYSSELPTLYEYYTNGGIKSGLEANGDVFRLNGKEIAIFGGSFHYFRVHQNNWREILKKFKAAGLNTVQLYSPWNLHEQIPGHFDFESEMLNITHFLTLIKEEDMFAMFRPGPYICAEWEFGGFPSWLLRDPNMKLRSNYEPYLEAVDKYFSRLYAIAKHFQFTTNGGPIIGIQIENEFSSYGNTATKTDDVLYLRALEKMALKYGMKELLFTSDPTPTRKGTLDEFLETVNFNDNAIKNLEGVKKLQPNKPLYVAEYWSGWFDNWGGKHNRVPPEKYAKELNDILFAMNSSVNIYMFIGGTNFGFMAGAGANWGWSSSGGIVTSYDYDAPLSESGNYTEKYWKTKELIEKFTKERNLPKIKKPSPPKASLAFAYGRVEVKEQLSLNKALKYAKSVGSESPVFMENLNIGPNYGQNFGFTLYRTTIPKSISLTFSKGNIHDIGFVSVDSHQIGFIQWHKNPYSLNITEQAFNKSISEHTLDILIENMGRVNWGLSLNNERKGIEEDILIDDNVQKNWQIFALDFKRQFIEKLNEENWTPIESYRSPMLYRTSLLLKDDPKDTYLSLDGWTTCQVFINGFNLGRYGKEGPTKTLYVPGQLLKTGVNQIVIFETQGRGTHIEFVDKPNLG